jgi:hypothetical protein
MEIHAMERNERRVIFREIEPGTVWVVLRGYISGKSM